MAAPDLPPVPPPPSGSAPERSDTLTRLQERLGLGLEFLHRVYRMSVALALLGALLMWEPLGWRAAAGWLAGCALSLGGMAGLEWAVRRYSGPHQHSPGNLASAVLGQTLGLLAAVGLVALAAQQRWLGILFVLPGFALPHAVILLKLLGRQLVSAAGGRGEGAAPGSGDNARAND